MQQASLETWPRSVTLIDPREILVSKCLPCTIAGKIYVSCRTEHSFQSEAPWLELGPHPCHLQHFPKPLGLEGAYSLTGCLLSARHCSKHIIRINSFNPPKIPMKKIFLLSPYSMKKYFTRKKALLAL